MTTAGWCRCRRFVLEIVPMKKRHFRVGVIVSAAMLLPLSGGCDLFDAGWLSIPTTQPPGGIERIGPIVDTLEVLVGQITDAVGNG